METIMADLASNVTHLGVDFVVNTTTASDQYIPAITGLADGRFVLTWYSFGEGGDFSTDIRGRVFNADGTPYAVDGSTADFVINTTTAIDQVDPSITGLPDGRFV